VDKKRIVVFGIFVLFIIVVLVLRLHDYISLEFLQQKAHDLHHFVQMHYWQSIIAYLIIFIMSTVALLPSTAALTIAGGFLFGTWWGTVYTIIGATSGSLASFFLMRYIFYQWVQRRFATQLAYFNREMRQYGARYLLIMQLLPFTPTDIINIIAGIMPLSWWTYAWTTALGIVPGTLIYTWAGQQLHSLQSVNDTVSFSLLFLLFTLALLIASTIAWNKMKRKIR
jgi:uncharacterized membrane protein YdjX (TVP38/TMEM64 family)